jgi:hypothetical protein
MKKFRLDKNYIILLLVFLVVNTLCLIYRNGGISAPFSIDVNVVVVANALLFILAVIGMYLHIKAAHNPNPQLFVRSVLLMAFLKFFILGIAAIAYVLWAKADRNIPGIIIGMILYVVYAVVEVRGAYKLNKKGGRKNG